MTSTSRPRVVHRRGTQERQRGQRRPAPGRPTTDRVRGIFASIADRYDLFNSLASLGIDRGWRKQLVRACALEPESQVLDLCSGTGDVAFALAEQGRPAVVVATDFVPQMLVVAKRKADRRMLQTPLLFSVADAQKLPFPDESFDVVTVAFGVRNLSQRRRNFVEVLRVLRPSGRYVILEFSTPRFAPWRGAYHVYLRHAVPAIGGVLTGDRGGFVYLNDSIRQFPSQARLAAELREAGFTTVTWKNLTGGIVAVHTAVK